LHFWLLQKWKKGWNHYTKQFAKCIYFTREDVFGKSTQDKVLERLANANKSRPLCAKTVAKDIGMSAVRIRNILTGAKARGLAIRHGQDGWLPTATLIKQVDALN
jgi:hypothetical protein